MSKKNKQTPNLFAGFKCLLFAVLAITLAVLLVPARANAQDKKERGKTTQTQKDTTTDDKVYEVCEQMPTYKGGEEAMMISFAGNKVSTTGPRLRHTRLCCGWLYR